MWEILQQRTLLNWSNHRGCILLVFVWLFSWVPLHPMGEVISRTLKSIMRVIFTHFIRFPKVYAVKPRYLPGHLGSTLEGVVAPQYSEFCLWLDSKSVQNMIRFACPFDSLTKLCSPVLSLSPIKALFYSSKFLKFYLIFNLFSN